MVSKCTNNMGTVVSTQREGESGISYERQVRYRLFRIMHYQRSYILFGVDVQALAWERNLATIGLWE